MITRIFREFIEATLLAIVIFFVVHGSIQNFRVEGLSMDPALKDGEMVIVNKLLYFRIDVKRLAGLVPFWDVKDKRSFSLFHEPHRGEVVVFNWPVDPERQLVKRVIGVPGDTVEIRSGAVYVTGTPLSEPYIASLHGIRENIGPVEVSEGYYFVMGDNRLHSNDSRDWGLVARDDIVGKIWLVYWPMARVTIFHAHTLLH